MITNDAELEVTLERLARFQEQVARLRRLETDPANYRASVSGFLAEIDRMQLAIREHFAAHPVDSEDLSSLGRGGRAATRGDQERCGHPAAWTGDGG